MKNQMTAALAAAAVSLFAGCAIESEAPTEGVTSSAVTEHATNYIVCTNKLAKRTCADPGGCDTGVRMSLGTALEVDMVYWPNKMAHFTRSAYGSGWALANNDGEVYISADPNHSCPD
jgi:hypothetical protein